MAINVGLTPITGRGGLMSTPQEMALMGAQMGQAIQSGRTREVMPQALMGDPQAMQQLMAVNPQAGMEVQQQLAQQAAARQQQEMAAMQFYQKNKEYFDKKMKDVAGVVAGMESPEEARAYVEREIKDLKQVFPEDSAFLDNISYESLQPALEGINKQNMGALFEGTGMHAQAFNLIAQAEKNPAIKDSPQYKLAVAYVGKPQIIQTEKGAVEIPGLDVAKIIGARKPVQEEDAEIAMVIKGTEKEKKFTQDENKALGFAGRMQAAEARIQELEGAGFKPAMVQETVKGEVPLIGNFLVSEEYQQYEQAKENWVSANLRKESGAVIGDAEMAKEVKKYFPVVGDSEEVMQQKAEARKIAERSMLESSRRTQKEVNEILKKTAKKDRKPLTDQELLEKYK